MSKFLSLFTYLIFVFGLFLLSTQAFLIFWGIQTALMLIVTLLRSVPRIAKKTHLPFMVEGVLSIILLPALMALNPIMYWSHLFAGEDLCAKQCWTFSDELLEFIWNFLHNKKPAYYN